MTRQQEVEINKLLNRQERMFMAQAKEPDEKIKRAIQVVIDLYFEKMESIERGDYAKS